jgi:hypothetical protein
MKGTVRGGLTSLSCTVRGGLTSLSLKDDQTVLNLCRRKISGSPCCAPFKENAEAGRDKGMNHAQN